MRPQPENDLVYLLMILESAGKIVIYNTSFNDALEFYRSNDQLNFNASLLLLANIGEQAGKVSEETKRRYFQIPWQQVKGFRNRIVHDYAGIDFEMAFDIIQFELPDLIKQVEELITIELKGGVFKIEEFEIAKASQFYSHVNFDKLGSKATD